jgi:D-alanyl-lipoteichoic acid acyltransferase DltB (MBOAT superfamily)
VLGLAGNLMVLGYFKYANFFVDNLNAVAGLDLYLGQVVLPLGISFFTFQKIAFLVDAYRGRVERLNLLDFSLFVSFFPQLIAGPIVHHSEIIPQLRRHEPVGAPFFALGLAIFTLGLAKKVLLADTAAVYVGPAFDAAAAGTSLDALTAWGAALAYAAQLYFDFSGYSDMAIGAGLLFGLRLPFNFDSPYQATSIIDFWRRWHITLSRFLREYLYIPLGGNRKGPARRFVNLFVTMLLGGLWHGAGWTFVIWGGLHGLYLIANHGWRALRRRLGPGASASTPLTRLLAWAVTFLAVLVAWVFFRAPDLATALSILGSMTGLGGPAEAAASAPALAGAGAREALVVAGALLAIAWLAPNTQRLTGYAGPGGELRGVPELAPLPATPGRAPLRWAAAVGVLLALSLTSLSRVSEFLYFQF